MTVATSGVGVAIGTFGDKLEWANYARRAMLSVGRQTVAADVRHVHGQSLHQARNAAAEELTGHKWLIFLDADDELDERYVERMLAGEGDIRRPATIGVYPDGTEDDAPVMIPRTDMRRTNCVVIGAMHLAKFFYGAGGFHDYPILEDWALWRKMIAAGASIGDVPDAVYRVHVRPGSRNTDGKLHGHIYGRILREVPL